MTVPLWTSTIKQCCWPPLIAAAAGKIWPSPWPTEELFFSGRKSIRKFVLYHFNLFWCKFFCYMQDFPESFCSIIKMLFYVSFYCNTVMLFQFTFCCINLLLFYVSFCCINLILFYLSFSLHHIIDVSVKKLLYYYFTKVITESFQRLAKRFKYMYLFFL